MRDIFRAYYAPSDQELDELWSTGAIILDTNTLLNFFRYTPSTREEFLSVLESLKDSLWIPHHVGLEFHRRRLEVISSTSEAFAKIKDALGVAKNGVTKTLNEYKHHPSINRAEVASELDELFKALEEKLETRQHSHEEWIGGEGDPERTFVRLSDLFTGRIGVKFTSDEIDAICSEGEDRYEKKIPPGFKDANKTNGNQYGDLIIWKEILKLGETTRKPAIFVTDDSKEDWWRIERGKTQGPRVELIDEYWEASEQRIHFYEPLQFLKYAQRRTQVTVSQDSLTEVGEVSSASERAQRVLRERRDQLRDQRRHYLQSIERQRRDSLDPGRRQALHEELDMLKKEQQELDLHMRYMDAEEGSLLKRLSHFENKEGHEEEIEQIASRLRHRSSLGQRAESLAQRRQVLERKLNRPGRDDERMMSMWDKRLRRLDDELQEVTLALDDLES